LVEIVKMVEIVLIVGVVEGWRKKDKA